MKVKSILIALGICVLMFGVGFGVTTIVRGVYGNIGDGDIAAGAGPYDGGIGGIRLSEPSVSKPSYPVSVDSSRRMPVESSNANGRDRDSVSELKRPAVQPLHLVIEKVDGPLFMVRSRKYSVTVKLQDQDKIDAGRVVYELYDDGNNLIASEKSPSLIVPQSRSGVYSVIVKDTETGYRSGPYKITGCRIQRVEKGRLEHICNSGDYNIMGKTEAYAFSPSLTLEFSGISGEEDKAASIDDICTRISLGIWSSVSVMDIRYDDLNRVEYVKFKVEE